MNQGKVIFNAFKDTLTGDLPKNESDYPKWFKDRYDKCLSCEYNIDNMDTESLDFISKAQKVTFNKGACSICHCFVKQKAWAKTEACGIEKTGAYPLWNRHEIVTRDKDPFNLVNLSYGFVNIGIEDTKESFVIDFGSKNMHNIPDINLQLISKNGVVVNSDNLIFYGDFDFGVSQKTNGTITDITINTKSVFGEVKEGFNVSVFSIPYNYMDKEYEIMFKIIYDHATN